MGRILSNLLVLIIVITPGRTEMAASSYEVSYIAKWKNNTDAALSLTFDDNGAGDNRNVAAAILEEYGVHGTFNAITSYMNEEMFLDMFHRGHELGSHSVNHLSLKGASIDTVMYELTESKQAIENLTGASCVSYAAPYGYLDPNIVAVAQDLYISTKGTDSGINAIAGANIFDLKMGPVPPYYDDSNTNWTNVYYYERMREYLGQVIAAQGWGIQLFHGLTSRVEWNSSSLTTETTLRDYLSVVTTDLASEVWIAPQGRVARYHVERQETEINTWLITNDIILVDLLFDGDKNVFNEPLTVITQIPPHFFTGNLTVMQNGKHLNHALGKHDIVSDTVGSLRISGNIDPDATGIYVKLPDSYGGKPAYKAMNKEFYVWYNDGNSRYYLSTVLGGGGSAAWFSVNREIPLGDYKVDNPIVTGMPKALAIPQAVSGVKYDALPGAGAVSIVFEPIAGDLDRGGEVDTLDRSILSASWLEQISM